MRHVAHHYTHLKDLETRAQTASVTYLVSHKLVNDRAIFQGLSRLPSQVTDSQWEIWDKELGGDMRLMASALDEEQGTVGDPGKGEGLS